MGASAQERAGPLFSIGYGDRPWEQFAERLAAHDIRYVIDVRSRPVSRQAEFNRDALASLLQRSGIRYVYLGDALGGQPEDSDCYVDGHVDYERCRTKKLFQQGLDRLITAFEGGHRAAVMCSELDPERCHRSKLIGEALLERGVPIFHIDRDGSLSTQQEVIDRVTGGQSSLFGRSFRSRGRYPSPVRSRRPEPR